MRDLLAGSDRRLVSAWNATDEAHPSSRSRSFSGASPRAGGDLPSLIQAVHRSCADKNMLHRTLHRSLIACTSEHSKNLNSADEVHVHAGARLSG